jgi:hypothetical protein
MSYLSRQLSPVDDTAIFVLYMRSRGLGNIAFEACVLCRALAIEHDADLFQSDRLGLGIGEVDHQDLENDNHAYDDVVSRNQSV